MPYPLSPFITNFNEEFLVHSDNCDTKFESTDEIDTPGILKWLCTCPKISSYRVNTITSGSEEVLECIRDQVKNVSQQLNRLPPKVEMHPTLKDTIIVHNWEVKEDLLLKKKEIIIDSSCAEAVLRGAHIFAPGVLGMFSGTKVDDEVSIYVDIERTCKKGLQKTFEGKKIHIGNGRVKMIRHQLFGKNIPSKGLAIEVLSTTSGCPPLENSFSEKALLQNLPSIICAQVLNPQPGEIILDMCASPGNKTTHLAALMENKGTLIAIDKTPNKVKQLQETCYRFSAKVHVFQADSTKILSPQDVSLKDGVEIDIGPPFLPETFDRILLDGPCSALGKRPQLSNLITKKVLLSYVPLQRKLFETAVNLLKIQGTLVYSTCTITTAENEGIIAWALNKFPCLELKKCQPYLGGPGSFRHGLSKEACNKVQRFGPEGDVDSVGFFIACFIKNKAVC